MCIRDSINGGSSFVERLLKLQGEANARTSIKDSQDDAEKDRRDAEEKGDTAKKDESIELESLDLDELKVLAGLMEFDSKVSSKANIIGRKIGADTTGQQFGAAADDLEKGKSTLGGKALQAIKPYIRSIVNIMKDPTLFAKFQALMQQADNQMQAEPAESVDLSDVKESLAYGMPEQSDESENVTYSKTKKDGDAQVTISANAKSMDELHDVLKLAGITLPKSDQQDDEEHDHDEVDPFDKDGDKVCDGCGREIVDGECGCDDHDHGGSDEKPKATMKLAVRPEMSTDKQVLVNYLKDKLAKRLS